MTPDLLIPPPPPEHPTPAEWEAYLAKRQEARRSMALVMEELLEKCQTRLLERGVSTKEKKELKATMVRGKKHLAALGFPEGVNP